LLYFNEVKGKDENHVLELYFAALKHRACGGDNGRVYDKSDNSFKTGASE